MQDYQTTPYPSVEQTQPPPPQTLTDDQKRQYYERDRSYDRAIGVGNGGSYGGGQATNTNNDYQYNNYGAYQPYSYNDDDYASKTYANVIRAEYDDYKARFQPYEERLMSLADSRELLDQQLGRITTNINKSYANPQHNAGALQQRRYGISQSTQSSNQNNRQNNLNRALSMAHAKNNTRVADSDRRFDMVTGSDSQRANVMRQSQGG